MDTLSKQILIMIGLVLLIIVLLAVYLVART